MKRTASLLFCIAISLFMASCRAGQTVAPESATQTVLPEPTQMLTATPIPVATAVSTPLPEATQTSTDTPLPATAMAICHIPYYDPVAFMPDNIRLLVRDNSGVRIFNLETLEAESYLIAPKNLVPAAALSPDGQTLAWALEDNTIQLIRVLDQTFIHTLAGHTDMVTALKFSPAGDKLFSASHDTWVRIWDLDGKQLDAYQPTGADDLPSEVLGFGISPDGLKLATIPLDGPMKLWDLDGHSQIAEFHGSISGGYDGSDVAFSPDGQFIAQHLGAGGGYLSLWRISDGSLLFRSENLSLGVAFSPDGRYLAHAEMDPSGVNRVVVRSADGNDLIRVLEGPENTSQLGKVIFSPDSTRLVAVDNYISAKILIWQVANGKLQQIRDIPCP